MAKPDNISDQEKQIESKNFGFLGISSSELTGVSIDELTGNKVAITMLVHYYKQFSEENTSLKTDLTSLQTYVAGFREKKTNARVGGILLAGSNVLIGFGVNLLTNNIIVGGLAVFLPGLVMAGIGLYFSLKKVD